MDNSTPTESMSSPFVYLLTRWRRLPMQEPKMEPNKIDSITPSNPWSRFTQIWKRFTGVIMEADIAAESTRFVRSNMPVQSSAIMNAQANQLSSLALTLIKWINKWQNLFPDSNHSVLSAEPTQKLFMKQKMICRTSGHRLTIYSQSNTWWRHGCRRHPI